MAPPSSCLVFRFVIVLFFFSGWFVFAIVFVFVINLFCKEFKVQLARAGAVGSAVGRLLPQPWRIEISNLFCLKRKKALRKRTANNAKWSDRSENDRSETV